MFTSNMDSSEFAGTPHPIYILNEIISKILTEHFDENEMLCNTFFCVNKQESVYRINSVNNQIKAPLS